MPDYKANQGANKWNYGFVFTCMTVGKASDHKLSSVGQCLMFVSGWAGVSFNSVSLWVKISLFWFNHSIKFDLTVPRRYFFCGLLLLFMCHVCLCYAVHLSIVITCWEKLDLLAFLCAVFSYVLSISNIVFQVRFGSLLYPFLIFASISTCIVSLIRYIAYVGQPPR